MKCWRLPRPVSDLVTRMLNAHKHPIPSRLELEVGGQMAKENAFLLQIQILEIPTGLESSQPLQAHHSSTTDLIFRLSLVKKLIELEGGQIEVTHTSNSGGFLIQCQLQYPLVP